MDTNPIETERSESDSTDDDAETAATASVVEADDAATDGGETDTEAESGGSSAVGPLTITLPDGSESVSEAILSHRRMLTNPSDHGLVSADEADEAREAIETLSEEVPEDLQGELETLNASIEGMTARLDRHERRIAELQDTVESLAEILGASVEFEHRGKA
ncbi:hypothetical protein ACFR97_15080 [Haloplanus litoreus]|uniref:Uncharacterized protein n=1 Tax=Haloplanus litoreus TaxID=767515 RepID=A0ABD5ZWK5_9EURY